jgi:long-chain acyl-CoA synthetase
MSPISTTFFDHARRLPDKAALCCDGQAISYGDLAMLVRRWSAGLVAAGIRHGDLVGVVLPNCPEFVALMLAAADLGLVLVPVSPSLTHAALVRAFTATHVRHLVATTEVLQALAEERATTLAGADGLWLAIDAPEAAALLASGGPDPAPFGWGKDEDAFILTMTSGSTSDPKPIVLSQRTKLNRAMAAVEMYGVTAADVTLTATPLYHSLAERLVLIPLLTGGTSVLMTRFSPREWIETVGRHHVSFTIAVSSQLGQIVRALDPSGAPTSLRCVVSSSALLEAGVKAELRARLSCDLHECYGASEIAVATTLDMTQAAERLNSVGRAAPGVEIRILDDGGASLPAGTVGEIACRTPMLFSGYHGQPELTQASMCGGFFRTGDLGRLDQDGFLYFLGRKKEIIITGGINVYPIDVEETLLGYDGLIESAAFAVADERLGEVIGLAYVTDGRSDFDLRQMRRHFARKLADFQQPRKFLALPALPRNAMGKVMRRSLLGLYLAVEDGTHHA